MLTKITPFFRENNGSIEAVAKLQFCGGNR
jgi:hypothetical protein